MDSAEPNSGTNPPAPDREPIHPHDLRQAIADLVQAMEKDVFGFVLKRVDNEATAWDLTQDTFLRVWKARDQLDPTKNSRAWVMTIAEHVLASHFRAAAAQKRGRPIDLDHVAGNADRPRASRAPPEPIDPDCSHPVDDLVRAESIDAMDRAASQLTEKERELYRLRREGLSTAEIAKKTGRPATSIGPALTRLLAKLRRKLLPDEL